MAGIVTLSRMMCSPFSAQFASNSLESTTFMESVPVAKQSCIPVSVRLKDKVVDQARLSYPGGNEQQRRCLQGLERQECIRIAYLYVIQAYMRFTGQQRLHCLYNVFRIRPWLLFNHGFGGL